MNLAVFALSAAAVGFIHTILGPDHYLPFAALGWSGRWMKIKMVLLVVSCGAAHVAASAVLAALGVLLGTHIFKLAALDAMRGNVAAWLLIIFGFTYFAWGAHRAFNLQSGLKDRDPARLGPGALFTIFILGPCEPLVPLIMYPAVKGSITTLVMVVVIFSAVTVATMLTMVFLVMRGMGLVRLGRFTRFAHAAAGCVILLSGLIVLK